MSREQAGLNRIQTLLAALGHPERKLSAVQIAGTTGKGSTTTMLAAVLREAGYRTGSFVSPHLQSYRERISVDGAPIDEATWVRLAQHVAADPGPHGGERAARIRRRPRRFPRRPVGDGLSGVCRARRAVCRDRNGARRQAGPDYCQRGKRGRDYQCEPRSRRAPRSHGGTDRSREGRPDQARAVRGQRRRGSRPEGRAGRLRCGKKPRCGASVPVAPWACSPVARSRMPVHGADSCATACRPAARPAGRASAHQRCLRGWGNRCAGAA